jgi:hypothetical protein
MRLRCGASRWRLERFASADISGETPLSEALRKVYAELDAGYCDFIAVTGNLAGAGCFELQMPHLKLPELEAALEFELPRYLPGGADGVLWCYRALDFTDRAAAKRRVRVFFVQQTEWERFTGELERSGIKADGFIYPFMAVGPELAGLPVFLPEVDAKFYWSAPGQDGLRHMEPVASCADPAAMSAASSMALGCPADMEPALAERCLACLLTAKYVSGKHWHGRGGRNQLTLPASLCPRHCRLLKRLTIASGMAALISLGLWLGAEWRELHGRYSVAQQEIATVKHQLDAEKAFLRQNASRSKAVSKVLASLPNRAAVLQLLCYLAPRLPKDIAMNSYNMQGNRVQLTMKCASDPENALAQVGDSARYTVENLRKNRNFDGSYYLYLVLTIND